MIAASLAGTAVLLCLIMAFAWLVQQRSGRSGWIDAIWSFAVGLAGLELALLPVAGTDWPTTRQLLVAGLVTLWSLRLGCHIAARACGADDPRYAALRERWGGAFATRLFRFLQIQAAAAFILSLSVLAAAQNPLPGLRLQDIVGLALLLVALAGEALADRQLKRFKADPANRGGICDRGLWGWSRHPNYFFEWLGWCAYPLLAIDLAGDYAWGWVALAGPALMYWLLVHASGIPPLEAHMARSRGPAFAAYRARVSAFFPWPPRSRA